MTYLIPVPDAPFEIAVSVSLHVTVNGFPVAETEMAVVVVVVVVVRRVVPSIIHHRCVFVVVVRFVPLQLSLDPDRAVHHVIGHRALGQRSVELSGERHLVERVHVLVQVIGGRVQVMRVRMIVVVAVEPERVGLGERGRRPERLHLLGRLGRAPVHVVVVGRRRERRRRAHDGVQGRELVVVVGRVETARAAEERPAAQELFVVTHCRAGRVRAEFLLEVRLSAARLFRGAASRERRRQYFVGVESQLPATAAACAVGLLVLVMRRLQLMVIGFVRQRGRERRELFERTVVVVVCERQAVHLVAGRRGLHRRRRLKPAPGGRKLRRGRRRSGELRERSRRRLCLGRVLRQVRLLRFRACHRGDGLDGAASDGGRLEVLELEIAVRRRRQVVDRRAAAVGRQVHHGRQVGGLRLRAAARRRSRLQRRRRRDGHCEHVLLLRVVMVLQLAADAGHRVRRHVLTAGSQQTCATDHRINIILLCRFDVLLTICY